MFNTSNDKSAGRASGPAVGNQPAINIIGSGTQIEGEIKSESDIRIDGKVKGTVTSKAKIVVGSTGMIDGDLNCENADISGKVFGKVEVTDLLFLKSTGYLEGDIITGKLVVEAGARFTGSCKMGVKEMKPSEKAPSALQKEAI
ncbi:MAG: polymer-forming cytoskeletal protein [Chitinophagales bacterium]|nr:polymer-forming cytoskeletal protein [Chitinophagales bacterium]MDW8426947.1 polymer-forming cytoskeletal protein [Chitinophagales bacterium]